MENKSFFVLFLAFVQEIRKYVKVNPVLPQPQQSQ
jgi:hypothetical protein